MGSSISRNIRQFDITFEEGYGQQELLPIIAGSTLCGNVVLTITSPIILPPRRHTNNNSNSNDEYRHPRLQLRLYGKEKVRIQSRYAHRISNVGGSSHNNTSSNNSTTTTSSTNTKPTSYVAEREFLSIPIQWHTFPMEEDFKTTKRMIPIGTYSFPFQIKLPTSIPSSTYYPNNNDNDRSSTGSNQRPSSKSFRIQYKIMATIHVPSSKKAGSTIHNDDDDALSPPHARTVRYVWIAANTDPSRIPVEPVPCMVQPIAMELRNALFFQKGIFLFGASMDNTQLFVRPIQSDGTSSSNNEQIIALHVSCRNDSSIHIQKVQISIMEKLVWNTIPTQSVDARTGAVITTSTAWQQVHHRPIVVLDHVQLPGLCKESKGMIKTMMEGMFGTTKQNLQRQVYNDLISGENLIPITIPSSISYNGTIDDVVSPMMNKAHRHPVRNTMLRESYQGQLIQISHYVKIVFHTGTFCKTPTLEIPIQILPTPVDVTTIMNCNTNTTTASMTGAGRATYQPPSTTKSRIPSTLPNSLSVSAATTTTPTPSRGEQRPATTTNGSVEDTTTSSYTSTEYIPMATAVIVPTLPPNHHYEADQVTSDVIVLGGDAILQQQQVSSRRGFFQRNRPILLPSSSHRQQGQSSNQSVCNNNSTSVADVSAISTKLSNLVPLSAPTKQLENAISVPALLSSMRSSMLDNYEYIQRKLCEPEWIELFHTMSSHEYGSIIANVHDFDQPRVALLLVPFINHQHGGCNCEYAAAAIRHSSTNHRAITAQKLIPCCVDINTNHSIILEELNGWEQTVTESTLAEAMRG